MLVTPPRRRNVKCHFKWNGVSMVSIKLEKYAFGWKLTVKSVECRWWRSYGWKAENERLICHKHVIYFFNSTSPQLMPGMYIGRRSLSVWEVRKM